jgi:hypothetical protein
MSSNSEGPRLRSLFRFSPYLRLLVGFVALLTLFAWYRFTLARGMTPPFDISEFASISVPDDRNAFTYYRQANPLFVNEPRSVWSAASPNALSNREATIERGWPAANDDCRSWVKANRTALELWKQGTQCTEALDIPPATLMTGAIGANLPDVTRLRDFPRLALLEAARVSAERSPADAWPWYAAALRSSRHIGMHAPTIGWLFGVAVHNMAVDPILSWSTRPELTAADLRRALSDLQTIEAMTSPLSENLKAEYAYSFANVDQRAPGWSELPMKLIGYNDRLRRGLNLVYANWLTQADRPRPHRTPASGQWFLFEFDGKQPPIPGLFSPAEIEKRCGLAERRMEAVELNSVISMIANVFVAVDREQTEQAALIVGLALQLYHRDRHQFPATLDELVKEGYLKSIPIDPFGKGEPFHYRREADSKHDAILWGVWLDGIDQDAKIEIDRERPNTPGDKIFRIVAPRSK